MVESFKNPPYAIVSQQKMVIIWVREVMLVMQVIWVREVMGVVQVSWVRAGKLGKAGNASNAGSQLRVAEQVYGNIAFGHTPTKIAVCAILGTRMTRTKGSIALNPNGQ